MSYKYISKYKQFENDEVDNLKNILQKKNGSPYSNILEVGTQAGLVTLMLSEVAEKVTTIDDETFWSPSTRDHLKLNHITNVNFYQNNNITEMFEDKIAEKPEVVYVDTEKVSKARIVSIIRDTQKNDSNYKSVLFIHRSEGKFDVETIADSKKTTRKKAPVDKTPDA